ncbi:ATP-binding protein [Streptomyces roseus]|uniref:ATP-binding protein n=1 Tax=Streptomyces roseus TaxID=66430 RepID=UPI0033D44F91
MSALSVKVVGWARSFPVSRGVRAARQWTAGHLDSLPWDDSAADTVHSVLLSVSELVTNAHLHAAGTAHLVLTWDGRCLHVSVADSDPRLPAPRPADAEADAGATSGRGLGIVTTLADAWDVHACHGGKAITACFRPYGGADPHTGAAGSLDGGLDARLDAGPGGGPDGGPDGPLPS